MVQSYMSFDSQEEGSSCQPPNKGQWTSEEHNLFLQGVLMYGREWKKMQPLIKTRSIVQIRTHAQKVFKGNVLNIQPRSNLRRSEDEVNKEYINCD